MGEYAALLPGSRARERLAGKRKIGIVKVGENTFRREIEAFYVKVRS